ncbi:metallophosphoesterase [Cohnella rhizosphaerae]|uniref:Metallophosphoesterase n=1 Tax=Cohnella rhizosphaerae TaxID=1457232 RepID=A0A9X4KXW3_9BACL|nr:metallophosphoesterase [Cohnella rhizosphaerae]MDG0812885.1 metallophosphoesterase [Cohnella rhizosphaerae]
MRRGGLRAVLTFALVIAAYLGLNFFIGWNAQTWLNAWLPGFPGAALWTLLALAALGYLIGRLRFLPKPVGRGLKVFGAYYIGLFEYAVLLLPIADLAVWLFYEAGSDYKDTVESIGFVVAVLLLLLFAWGTWNAWTPIVRKYEIDVEKAAGGRRRMDIVLVSDLHLGNIVGNRHLDRLLPRVERIKPDLILLAGDVLDDVIEPFIRNRMAERLGRLAAPLGVYAVLGNHEYYGGHIEEYVERMAALGIPVLRDERATPGGILNVVGRKDKAAESMDPQGRKPVAELLKGVDRSLPIILMDHQPYGYAADEEAGVDIVVSGHTHRGQFAPNHWVTGRLFELDWGYLRKGRMHAVVSSGYGTWGPPVRLASRSEIVHLSVTFSGGA